MSEKKPFQYDIFVSYAQVDDQPTSGMTQGWVTTLVHDLSVVLDQRCGRIGASRIWWDQGNLPHHGNITPAIEQTLDTTGLLLVIYSQGYLSSGWCRAEREHFVSQLGAAGADRIFLVERDRIDLARRPAAFGDMLPHRFWERQGRGWRTLGVPSTHQDDAYFTALDRLATELYEEMQRLGACSTASPASPVGNQESPNQDMDTPDTVFLAQVTEDLDAQRNQVRDYLQQAGIRVVPDRLYPSDGEAFDAALAQDLPGCALFAQLLGPLVGRKLAGLDSSYVARQHQAALAGDKAILQWRSRDLDLNTVDDSAHRNLLDGEAVMAVDLTEFKRSIVQRLEQERHKRDARRRAAQASIDVGVDADTPASGSFVFLGNTRSDRDQAERIGEILSRRGYAFASTLTDGEPGDIKEDLEANLKECDGLIIVHGQSSTAAMRRLLRNCRTWISRREQPIRALALYQGPPPETKGNLGMGLGRMLTIDCHDGLDETRFLEFLHQLNPGEPGP
jgi:hypothetical protein